MNEFMARSGWCTNFYRRYDFNLSRSVGEGGDVNDASAEVGRHRIPLVLLEVGAHTENVFNADETGIIFGAQPHQTLVPISVLGTKKDMDQVLCCNFTSTKRLKHVMCGKVAVGIWHHM